MAADAAPCDRARGGPRLRLPPLAGPLAVLVAYLAIWHLLGYAVDCADGPEVAAARAAAVRESMEALARRSGSLADALRSPPAGDASAATVAAYVAAGLCALLAAILVLALTVGALPWSLVFWLWAACRSR